MAGGWLPNDADAATPTTTTSITVAAENARSAHAHGFAAVVPGPGCSRFCAASSSQARPKTLSRWAVRFPKPPRVCVLAERTWRSQRAQYVDTQTDSLTVNVCSGIAVNLLRLRGNV